MIPSNAWLNGADDCNVLALRGVSLHFTFCSLDLLSFLIVAYHTTSHVIACNLSIRVGVFSHDRRDSLFPCTQSASFTTAMVSHPVLPTNYQSMTFVTRVVGESWSSWTRGRGDCGNGGEVGGGNDDCDDDGALWYYTLIQHLGMRMMTTAMMMLKKFPLLRDYNIFS